MFKIVIQLIKLFFVIAFMCVAVFYILLKLPEAPGSGYILVITNKTGVKLDNMYLKWRNGEAYEEKIPAIEINQICYIDIDSFTTTRKENDVGIYILEDGEMKFLGATGMVFSGLGGITMVNAYKKGAQIKGEVVRRSEDGGMLGSKLYAWNLFLAKLRLITISYYNYPADFEQTVNR